jgi:hypothetical protein
MPAAPIARKKSIPSPSNPDQEVNKFLSGYVGSPKYQQRLAGFYQYPGYVNRQRQGVIDNVSIRENPNGGSSYYANGNEVAISNPQAISLGSNRQEVLSHEMSHALNSNWKIPGSALSPAEQNFILDRNKRVSGASKAELLNHAKQSGKQLYDLMGEELHDQNPAESKSDIDALRFLLNKRGLYNAGKQDMTPEILLKAKKDPVIGRSFIMKRLNENFDDKGLLEIMNKVATNNNSNQSKIA